MHATEPITDCSIFWGPFLPVGRYYVVWQASHYLHCMLAVWAELVLVAALHEHGHCQHLLWAGASWVGVGGIVGGLDWQCIFLCVWCFFGCAWCSFPLSYGGMQPLYNPRDTLLDAQVGWPITVCDGLCGVNRVALAGWCQVLVMSCTVRTGRVMVWTQLSSQELRLRTACDSCHASPVCLPPCQCARQAVGSRCNSVHDTSCFNACCVSNVSNLVACKLDRFQNWL